MALVLGGALGAVGVRLAADLGWKESQSLHLAMLLAYLPLACLAITTLKAVVPQWSPSADVGPTRRYALVAGFGVATGIAGLGVEWFAVAIGDLLHPPLALWYVERALSLEAPGQPAGWLVLGVAAVIVAPLAEEFAFRGVFLWLTVDRLGVVTAAACSSVAFGALHVNPVAAAVWGALAAWLALNCGLIAAIVAHAAGNMAALLAALLVPGTWALSPDRVLWEVTHRGWIGALGILAGGAACLALGRRLVLPK